MSEAFCGHCGHRHAGAECEPECCWWAGGPRCDCWMEEDG